MSDLGKLGIRFTNLLNVGFCKTCQSGLKIPDLGPWRSKIKRNGSSRKRTN